MFASDEDNFVVLDRSKVFMSLGQARPRLPKGQFPEDWTGQPEG